jgi:prolyl-tRNA synthetase
MGPAESIMRYKSALLPTQKEAPADAISKSHILLQRGGYIRRVGAGIYSFLPLGLRVLRKVEAIIREEMDRAGALELLLPALLPAEYLKETGRWEGFGDTLFRLKDRKAGDYHLGPTHEEIITDLARREIQSYRDMPKNLYQIQTKFRDEPRPRGGLLRCREFLMKDAYSFDVDFDSAQVSYEKMRVTYRAVFDRLGLNYRMVGADSGAMGGNQSAEFQVLVQSGEDLLAACTNCDYAENLEVAAPKLGPVPAKGKIPPREEVPTPGQGSIEDVARFLGAEPQRFLKSLVYISGQELVMAVVRGDHEVNEIKLARALGVAEVHLATAEDVLKATGAKIGFIGPIGFSGRVLVDTDAAEVESGITGAGKTDYHFLHVQHGRDFSGEVRSIRSMVDGDACPRCNNPVTLYRGIEAGHIFLLGTHYSEKMGANYLDDQSEKKVIVMGCYGIGVSRLVATTVEQYHDENGIRWPVSIAPYPVHIVQLGESPEIARVVSELEQALTASGLEPLVDDRDQRPGVKFKDADLLGMPIRVTIGDRGLKEGVVEVKLRSASDPKAVELVPLDKARDYLVRLCQSPAP